MIGFFDSGLGGLTILKEVIKILPEYSYIYLGDNARTPYGSKSRKVIYKFTVEGIEELFKRGAELIILACNTSSALTLRKIQQEFLPKHYPAKKVLGIIIPTAEEVGNLRRSSQDLNIGVLATEATANSLTYLKEITKINSQAKVYQQACPLLVPIIETGETIWEELDLAIKKYLKELFQKSRKIDTIILGCTHYALIEDKIKKCLSQFGYKNIKIISQGPIVAKKLKDYLKRHPEIENKLLKTGEKIFLTTGDSEKIKSLAKMFYGEAIQTKFVKI